MAQHFLLSAKARTLSIATMLRMSDAQAEQVFAGIRWPATGDKAAFPHCGCPICYECRRPSGALRFRCKACRKDFSLTSGTLFAFHKMPLRIYLAATMIFCNEVNGVYFGAYVKPANHKEKRRDRRLVRNQTGKRQCVVIRQRDGMVMPSAFKTEGSALAYIRNHVAAGIRGSRRRRE